MNTRALTAAAACMACLVCLARPQSRCDSGKRLPRDADTFRYLSPQAVRDLVPPSTASLGLVASHTPGAPCPNLLRYLRELAEQFEVLVLLTNRHPPPETLPPNCRVVIAPNQGLDFGKWMYVLHHARLPALRRLGLFNDSAFLVRGLRPCFDQARRRGWPVWGMTSSTQEQPHLQSYFVVADGAAAARHMLAFFSGRSMQHTMAPCYSKMDLVYEFEIGLSAHMASRFPLGALFSVGDDSNPSLDHWDALLDRGCPLLKKLRRKKDTDALTRLDPEYVATIAGIDDRVFVTPPPT